MSTRGFKFQKCPSCAKRGVWLARQNDCCGAKLPQKWLCRYCDWWRWKDDWAPGFDKVVEEWEKTP